MLWCASKWAERMKIGWEAAHALQEGRFLFIKYEDVLSKTELVFQDVCNFLGIPFSDRMLEHHKYTRVRLDGKLNYGKEIIPNNVEKWRQSLDPPLVERIEAISFITMDLYSYPRTLADKPRPLSYLEKMRGAAIDTAALLIVGNRARKQNNIYERLKDLFFELRKSVFR